MQSTHEVSSIPLAIIGMGCRLPGADNLDEYWRLIVDGKSAIGELPPDCLDQELYFDPRKGVRGKTYSKIGALISKRPLDRGICPIPEELERSVDVAHVRMCEVAASALRHAGLDPFDLPIRNVGVYIGHAQGSRLSGDYTYATCLEEAAQFLMEVEEFRALSVSQQQAIITEFVNSTRARLPVRRADSPDVGASMVSGTISKAFGLTGPFLALNSACASSLQTMLLAARALQLGRVEMAIAGGASDCKGDSLVLFANAQSMSSTGSRPFDADADGLICAEGYVAVVMKTLERALADGDRIHAVVRGLGAASDGRGKSLWAPRKEGQIEAMQQAYRDGLDIGRLQYIEAHATATQLGDATELDTISDVLRKHFPPGKKIPITSIKANIGHTLESAGIAGVIKTVLSMQHRTIPPAVNVRQLNPKIDWAKSSVYIPLAPEPWPAPTNGLPRCAGVNAFGIGGLNMHVVLEEFCEASKQLAAFQNTSEQTNHVGKVPGTPKNEPIAVIGMGCILPGAPDVNAFWQLLAEGGDPKTNAPPDRWRADLAYKPGTKNPFQTPSTLGGYITDFKYDWRIHKLPPKQIEQADPLQFMLLEAADQAIKDAGYDRKPFDRTRVGVAVGTEFGGDFAFQLQMALRLPEMQKKLSAIMSARNLPDKIVQDITLKFADRLIEHWPALIDESGSFSTSSLASRITKTWDLMGGAAAIDCGSASAMAALASSIDMLLAGDCNMVVCAAGQRRMSLPAYEALSLAGVLSTDKNPRSLLDADAGGYVPGEGVGVLLLKRLSDAQRDGDRIHAIIHSVGAAHHASGNQALEMAVKRSLDIASARPDDIALLETDGCGVRTYDHEQLRAVASVYGQGARSEPLLVSETISRIGHTGGASGMVSMIKTVEELDHRQATATAGLNSLPPAVIEAASVIRTPTDRTSITPHNGDGRLLGAVVSSDRGLTFHALLECPIKIPMTDQPKQPTVSQIQASRSAPAILPEAGERPKSPAIAPRAHEISAPSAQVPTPTNKPVIAAQSGDWRILRLGGASPEDIRRKLEQAQSDVAASFAAAATSKFSPSDRMCLAIVADTPAALSEKLALSIKQIGNPSAGAVLESQGIFYRSPGVTRPRIAFLFPGQASQYVGMLKELVRDVPAARRAMDQADSIMQKNGFHSYSDMAWEAGSGAGTDIWITQCSMLLADRIVLEAILDRGIRPHLVTGHSYGEYVAIMASGAWDFEQAMLATRARCEAIASSSNSRGSMLATNAPPSIVEQLAQRLDEPVYVANYNSPDQVVAGGRQGAIADLAELLQREGHQARILAVPCPFHTPLMKEAAFSLESALKRMRIDRPAVPFITAVKNQTLSDPDEIRANLVAHMSTPIRFDQMIRTIADQAPTVFVEVGPQQVLTRLVRRILGQEPADAIACDNPKRPGVEQLWHVQALLECTGAWEPAPETAQEISSTAIKGPATVKPTAEVLFFDATARRREKMRQTAEGQAITPSDSPDSQIASPMESERMLESDHTLVRELKSSTLEHPMNGKTPKDADLEKFLIHFVVEHTGYPEEVVELDADLEADLGIDSIKKAQLFGELREYFDITPDANLTLDDFPTLRHVLNYLRGGSSERTTSPVALQENNDEQPAIQRFTQDPCDTGLERELLSHSPDVIMGGGTATAATPVTAAPAPIFTAPIPAVTAPTPTASYLAPVPNTVAVLAPPAVPGKAPDASELESFLIHFVVEHTGYPEEVVELDADLEADLGIDSIKKAQLFGELREYFDITPDANLTLDDFPTLRHVLNYLQGNKPAANGNAPAPAAQQSIQTQQEPGARRRLYEIGFARGQAEKKHIRQALHRYADVAGSEFDQTLLKGGTYQDLYSKFSQEQLEELQGIADGAEVALENIAVYSQIAHDDDILLDDKAKRPEGNGSGIAEQKIEQTPSRQVSSRENKKEFEPDEELFQAERQTQRFIMRMVDAPFKDGAPTAPKWHGSALLIGQSALNAPLKRCLEGQGVRVVEIEPTGRIDADLCALDELWNRQPIMHVFLTAARDPDSGDLYEASAWNERRNRRLLSPYFLCQRWLQLAGEADLLDQCTLVGATGLGGDFGFSGLVASPESGGITGLLKGIWMEFVIIRERKGMIIKAIDAPDDEPPDLLAANIVRELAAATMDYEVAFVGGRRRLQTALHQPASLQPRIRIRPGAAWIVTGGARGITARCALELGRRFGLRLHLIGSSPLPRIDPAWSNLTDEGLNNLKTSIMLQAKQSGEPIAKAWGQVEKALEIDGSLKAFTEAGVQATYHSCDVSDRNALARVLDEIRQADGPIEGIVHGAGIERSGRYERKNRTDVEATLGSKVDGARNLMELTRSDPVAYFIGFGSVSGRLGSNGQTDYCMASDLLCKLMSWYRTTRPDCRAVGIHWHGWDEVGMAAKPEVRAMFKRTNAPGLMPLAEGVRHLLREIFADSADCEVMITDWDCHQRFYKSGAEDEYRNKSNDSIRTEPAVSDAPNEQPPSKPLIECICRLDDGALEAEILFQPLNDPFLIEHRMRGRPFLPGVIGMEAIAQAAALWNPQSTIIGLQNVEIENGLAFTTDEPIAARVSVIPGKESAVCRLTTELRDRKNRQIQSERSLVRAEAVFAGQPPLQKAEPPGKPPQGWFPYRYPKLNEGIMYHGGPLRCLKECCFQYDGGWGKIAAPPLAQLAGSRDGNGWILPPAVLDACIVLCGAFAWMQFGASVEVPHGLKKLQIRRQPRPGEICIMRYFFRGRENGHSRFDFALFGDDEDVILLAEGYQTVMINEGG